MGKKRESYQDDINEEFNITVDNVDSDEDVISIAYSRELQSLADLIEARLGLSIETSIIDELVDAYEIDITDLEEAAPKVYNVYIKEFKN